MGAEHGDPAYEAVLSSDAEHLSEEAQLLISGADLSAFTAPLHAPPAVIDVDGEVFTRAVRVIVKEATDPIWKICLTSPWSLHPIKEGDVLFGTYRIREAKSYLAEQGVAVRPVR